MLSRQLRPEILDSLPADDPRAIHSRRDLQRVNVIMGHAAFVARTLRAVPTPLRLVVELGTGDGTMLLRVAEHLRSRSGRVRAVLVDQQPVVSAETRADFEALGWHVDVSGADVFEWLRRPDPEMADATVANLFLHHFDDAGLWSLLGQAARQTRMFVACEPRRSRVALAGASMLRLLGCNQLTVHDGLISVRAGFRDREISAKWPSDGNGWHLNEGRTGLFTHTFVATSRR
jgi:hypothetical protein